MTYGETACKECKNHRPGCQASCPKVPCMAERKKHEYDGVAYFYRKDKASARMRAEIRRRKNKGGGRLK